MTTCLMQLGQQEMANKGGFESSGRIYTSSQAVSPKLLRPLREESTCMMQHCIQ